MKKKDDKINLLEADLDDEESDDEDYVPDSKAIKECEKELGEKI